MSSKIAPGAAAVRSSRRVAVKRKFFAFGSLRLSYLDAGPRQPSGTILIAHANGFSAGCYAYYLRRLAHDYRVLALDFSGHGESEVTLDFGGWSFFRDQILALCAHESLQNVIGLGHSLGGACLMRASAATPGLFRKIIALDPVVLNVWVIALMKIVRNPMAGQALGRRPEFRSIELVERAFRRFGFEKEVFADFVSSCFRQENGRVVLACPPAVEARIFSQVDFGSLAAYGRLPSETHVLIPEKARVCTPKAANRIVRNNAASSLRLLPGVGHLFPLEEPALALAAIRPLLE